eukprot:SM000205S06235  [mRNA]  locus=s205:158736:160177:- [translate_table: standard]
MADKFGRTAEYYVSALRQSDLLTASGLSSLVPRADCDLAFDCQSCSMPSSDAGAWRKRLATADDGGHGGLLTAGRQGDPVRGGQLRRDASPPGGLPLQLVLAAAGPCMLARQAVSRGPACRTPSQGFVRNARGMKLFTATWLPAIGEPKGLVFLCHGYGMECSIFMAEAAERLALDDYAVFGLDYEGHGQSDGLQAYVKSMDVLVDDCIQYFDSVSSRPEYTGKARFLYGESMGGAVALLIHRKQAEAWNGAVFVAPMCKVRFKYFNPPATG